MPAAGTLNIGNILSPVRMLRKRIVQSLQHTSTYCEEHEKLTIGEPIYCSQITFLSAPKLVDIQNILDNDPYEVLIFSLITWNLIKKT